MFCNQCGNSLPDGAIFCNKCGVSVAQINQLQVYRRNNELAEQNDVEDTSDEADIFKRLIDKIISHDSAVIHEYVDKLRAQNYGITDDELARKILNRKSLKNGLVGAITGLGGLITLPVTVPADLAASWRIQAAMAFSIAYAYGHTKNTTDLKTDLYLILAGDAVKEVLKRYGIEIAKAVTKKMVQKYVTREVMKKIWKVMGQKIITKAGQKSLTSVMKMVPVVGAPVGFTFDYVMARIVGENAIKYYRGEG